MSTLIELQTPAYEKQSTTWFPGPGETSYAVAIPASARGRVAKTEITPLTALQTMDLVIDAARSLESSLRTAARAEMGILPSFDTPRKSVTGALTGMPETVKERSETAGPVSSGIMDSLRATFRRQRGRYRRKISHWKIFRRSTLTLAT